MKSPGIDCGVCGETKSITGNLACNTCAHGEKLNPEMTFTLCPACGGSQFYRKKDFNQALGCLIMIIGAVLVPWTYGLSLLVLALLDFFLYRRVKESVSCYRCKSEFRGIAIPDEIKPFDHHTAELFEKV